MVSTATVAPVANRVTPTSTAEATMALNPEVAKNASSGMTAPLAKATKLEAGDRPGRPDYVLGRVRLRDRVGAASIANAASVSGQHAKGYGRHDGVEWTFTAQVNRVPRIPA